MYWTRVFFQHQIFTSIHFVEKKLAQSNAPNAQQRPPAATRRSVVDEFPACLSNAQCEAHSGRTKSRGWLGLAFRDRIETGLYYRVERYLCENITDDSYISQTTVQYNHVAFVEIPHKKNKRYKCQKQENISLKQCHITVVSKKSAWQANTQVVIITSCFAWARLPEKMKFRWLLHQNITFALNYYLHNDKTLDLGYNRQFRQGKLAWRKSLCHICNCH